MSGLAHSVELGRQPAEIELLVVAGALLLGGALLVLRSGIWWASIAALSFAIAALVGAFVLPSEPVTSPTVPSSDPLLFISEPEAGAVVDASSSVPVSVVLENAPLSDGAQLLLLVDGRERQTSKKPEFRVRMRPGEHRLTVRYLPASGSETRPVEISVLIAAE